MVTVLQKSIKAVNFYNIAHVRHISLGKLQYLSHKFDLECLVDLAKHPEFDPTANKTPTCLK